MSESYLARFGETLVKHGYAVIPIVDGTKRPPAWMSREKSDPWNEVEPDIGRVKKWKRDPRLARAGVGINLSRHTFAIDLDIRDPALAAEMKAWCEVNLQPFAPFRVGDAPKGLFVFRCDAPIRKQTSRAFLDAEGRKCQVEGLGQGEQFVAYAVHPDTQRPYEWVGDGLLETPHAELPVISLPDVRAAIAAFEAMCEARGFKPEKKGAALATQDSDDWTATVDPGKAKLTIKQLRNKTFQIANDSLGGEQDFDTWLHVGMAIWHETDGSDEGYEIWHDWSSQSSKHVKAECERRWRSFDVGGKDRRPVTARYIIKLAGEARDEEVREALSDIKQQIAAAQTEEALRTAAGKAKHLDLDPLAREILAILVQRKFRQSPLDVPVTISMARNLVRYETKGIPDRPEWLERWVYISSSNEFYNRVTQAAMKPEAFDAAHGRHLLSDVDRREGKAVPDRRPSDLALNVFQIEVVDQRVYLPSQREDIFTYAGRRCVNTYTDRQVPAIPAKLSAADEEAIARVKAHVEWLLPNQREAALLLSFLSHVVKGGRVRWAILLHGVEGVGKTFFFNLMGTVLGSNNVRTIAPKELEDKFTPWAEGSQFNCIEEIRLHGHSRYDVINALKPHVTNDEVSVRRMRTDSYMAPNTASYMALTNYADALPIDNRDRRYMILSASPQKGDIEAKGPEYFADLFDAIYGHGGALRSWLTDYLPHPEFNADGRAPTTATKAMMIDLVEQDDVRIIREILEDASSKTGLSTYLLSTHRLTEALQEAGVPVPATRAMNRVMLDMGLTCVGRGRDGGAFARFWSDKPVDWRDADGQIDRDKLREWLSDDL